MLQYLLNLTATWLLSLVIFDLFLKKETYHAYNRIYLLSTMLIGILLPLWSWSQDGTLFTTSLGTPLKKATAIRQNIEVAATHSSAISFTQYLQYIYLAGVIISLIVFVFEVSKIILLYQMGNRSKEGKWTIVETVKGHAPFSVFHILFVDSKEQYTDEQWSIILDHEEQHSRLLHFADQLLIQIARIVFWFHPLVYIYNNRLMLLHEYQADKISGRQPAIYGKFLVEQALLHPAPKLTHSLNRSPIKTRIVMLTRTSSFFAKTKTLLFIPLVFICALCFSKNQYSNKIEKQGNFATYRGNTFEFSEASPKDTVMILDPVTGKERMVVTELSPKPIKMNGEKIYSHNDLEGTRPSMGKPVNQEAGFTAGNIKEYLVSNLSKELAKLSDGDYNFKIENIVIDKNGKVVYFEYGGINLGNMMIHDGSTNNIKQVSFSNISPDLQKEIAKKIYELLNDAPAHEPGFINGKEVPFYIVETAALWNPFTIKDHKVIKL